MNTKFKVGEYVYFMNYEIVKDKIPHGFITDIEFSHIPYVMSYFKTYMELSEDRRKGLLITDNDIKRKLYTTEYNINSCNLAECAPQEYVFLVGYFIALPRFIYHTREEVENEYELFSRVCYYYKGELSLHWNDFDEDFNIRQKLIIDNFFK